MKGNYLFSQRICCDDKDSTSAGAVYELDSEKFVRRLNHRQEVQIGRPRLSPLWRKDESPVRNKFAAGDPEDSDLYGTPYKSSAHSSCHFG
jgi:hypothetical protein